MLATFTKIDDAWAIRTPKIQLESRDVAVTWRLAITFRLPIMRLRCPLQERTHGNGYA
jgi:hypothetical protein